MGCAGVVEGEGDDAVVLAGEAEGWVGDGDDVEDFLAAVEGCGEGGGWCGEGLAAVGAGGGVGGFGVGGGVEVAVWVEAWAVLVEAGEVVGVGVAVGAAEAVPVGGWWLADGGDGGDGVVWAGAVGLGWGIGWEWVEEVEAAIG